MNLALACTLVDGLSSDEADVFLESRSGNTANIERNALVSSMNPPRNRQCGREICLQVLTRRYSPVTRSRILRWNSDSYNQPTENLRHSSPVTRQLCNPIQRPRWQTKKGHLQEFHRAAHRPEHIWQTKIVRLARWWRANRGVRGFTFQRTKWAPNPKRALHGCFGCQSRCGQETEVGSYQEGFKRDDAFRQGYGVHGADSSRRGGGRILKEIIILQIAKQDLVCIRHGWEIDLFVLLVMIYISSLLKILRE